MLFCKTKVTLLLLTGSALLALLAGLLMGGTYSIISLPQWYLEGRRLYGIQGFMQKKATWNSEELNVNLKGKHCLVTGANSGIGYAAADELAKRGASVHMVCRNRDRCDKAKAEIISKHKNDNVFTHILDVSEFQQVRDFARDFSKQHSSLHCLVNNAGALISNETKTPDGIETGYATMLCGTYLLTGLLLPLLRKAAPGSRVINVSSAGMYNVKLDVELDKRKRYDGAENYALAKRAQVVLTEEWAKRVPESEYGINFSSMHPGWAETAGVRESIPDFYEKHKDILRDSYAGADTIVWLAISETPLGKSGRFWFDREAVRTHMPAAGTKNSEEDAARLFERVQELCKWKLSLEEIKD